MQKEDLILKKLEKLDEHSGILSEYSKAISELKTDVSVLKTDVSVLKTDVSSIKGDVNVLKDSVNTLNERFEHFESEAVTKTEFKSGIAEILLGFRDLKDEYLFNNKHLREDRHQIEDHEKRIIKLEGVVT